MGRDIRVESKHFVYYGSKSSDLIMLFDRFFVYHPRRDIGDSIFFSVNLTRREMGDVLTFVKEDAIVNGRLYKDTDVLIERMNNIYIRMMPRDVVEIAIS